MSGETLQKTVAERIAVEVVLQNPRGFLHLDLAVLESWLSELLADLAPGADSFGVRFVNDDEMRSLNLGYRDRNSPTDVLSFPGEETGDGVHLGDVVISVPTARRQADAVPIPINREIRELLLHGILHCLGYDHAGDDGEMDQLELELRQKWTAHVG